jgi:hypothetical protein
MDKTIKQVAANNKVMLSWREIATYAVGGLSIGATAALGVGVYVANNYFKPKKKKKKSTTPTLTSFKFQYPSVMCINGIVYFTQLPSQKFKVPSNNNILFTIAADSGIQINPTFGLYACNADKITDSDNKPYPPSENKGSYKVKKDKTSTFTVDVPVSQKPNIIDTDVYVFSTQGAAGAPIFVAFGKIATGEKPVLTPFIVDDSGVSSYAAGNYDMYRIDEFVNEPGSPSSIRSDDDMGSYGGGFDTGAAPTPATAPTDVTIDF